MAVAAMRAVYGELPPPLGAGPDPLATRVLPVPFLVPARLAALAGSSPKAGAVLHRALGAATFGLTYHVALRTRALDEALQKALEAGVSQVVVLGAGLDGRAFRIPELAGVNVFEVDHPSTQRDKKARLAQANLNPIAHVEFVAVDFEKDELATSLVEAGFSEKALSFWIWEGVTAYLTRDAITSTLCAMARLSSPGSRVALTYVRPPSTSVDPSQPVTRKVARAIVHAGSAVLGAMGESIRGFTDSATMAQLAEDAGFVVRSDESAADWAKRYWVDESPGRFEWERIAVIERIG
jgi:methyltransferase (TIGR00027 family)